METQSILALKQAAARARVRSAFHAQIDGVQKKETKDGKPFYELTVADAEGKLTLRAWSDSPAYALCGGLLPQSFLEIAGEFYTGNFGLESRDWTCRELTDDERQALLAGPTELRARQAADYDFLVAAVETLADPRLRALGRLFFTEYGERFRRTGAARVFHHARRGGLVEHVAQMMRAAAALAGVYSALNRDLLLTGVLFHDCGKLWENVYPADTFAMPYTELGELLTHIPIGIETVNKLWKQLLAGEEAHGWAGLQPAAEIVRVHLLHLVAAHHGELQFGSPVVPKTPEAWALHHIDNLDAKLEMYAAALQNPKPLSDHPRIYERVWPLSGNLVAPLEAFQQNGEAPR